MLTSLLRLLFKLFFFFFLFSSVLILDYDLVRLVFFFTELGVIWRKNLIVYSDLSDLIGLFLFLGVRAENAGMDCFVLFRFVFSPAGLTMMSFGFLASALMDLVIIINSSNGIFPVIIYDLEHSRVRYIHLGALYVVLIIPGLQCPADDSSSNHGIQSGSFHHHASSFLLSFTPF